MERPFTGGRFFVPARDFSAPEEGRAATRIRFILATPAGGTWSRLRSGSTGAVASGA